MSSSRDGFETIVSSAAPARGRDRGSPLARALSGLLRIRPGAAERRRLRQELAALHEELFRIRAELALLRSRYAQGRRESFALTGLLRLGSRREVEAVIRAHAQPLPLPDGTLLCRVLARHNETAFDVGASYGYCSVLFAASSGRRAACAPSSRTPGRSTRCWRATWC